MMDYRLEGSTLYVAGKFAMTDLDEFRVETDKLLRHNPDGAGALEMSKCRHVNSLAIGQILRLVKKLRETNRKLIIKYPSPEVRVYLEVTKVMDLLDVVD
jgi:anti-anti-sigma regulatory factor